MGHACMSAAVPRAGWSPSVSQSVCQRPSLRLPKASCVYAESLRRNAEQVSEDFQQPKPWRCLPLMHEQKQDTEAVRQAHKTRAHAPDPLVLVPAPPPLSFVAALRPVLRPCLHGVFKVRSGTSASAEHRAESGHEWGEGQFGGDAETSGTDSHEKNEVGPFFAPSAGAELKRYARRAASVDSVDESEIRAR